MRDIESIMANSQAYRDVEPKPTLYDLPTNAAVTKRAVDARLLQNYKSREAEHNRATESRNIAESQFELGRLQGAEEQALSAQQNVNPLYSPQQWEGSQDIREDISGILDQQFTA